MCPLGEVLPLPPAQVAIVPWVLATGERKEGWELTRPHLLGRAGRLLSGAVPAPRPQAPVRLRSDVERGLLPSSPSLPPTDSKPLLSRCVGRAAGPPNGGHHVPTRSRAASALLPHQGSVSRRHGVGLRRVPGGSPNEEGEGPPQPHGPGTQGRDGTAPSWVPAEAAVPTLSSPAGSASQRRPPWSKA